MNEDELQDLYMCLITMGIEPEKAQAMIDDDSIRLIWNTIQKWAKEHLERIKYDLLSMFVIGRKLL